MPRKTALSSSTEEMFGTFGLRELIDSLPVALYTTDAEGRITAFNPAAAAFWGRSPEIGRDKWCGSWRLLNPDGSPMAHDQCPMAVALRTGQPVRGVDAVAVRPDGTEVPFLPYATPLHGPAGEPVGGVNMLVDLTQQKRSQDMINGQKGVLEKLATGHPLEDILATLVRLIEDQIPGIFGSILVREPQGDTFSLIVAPTLPSGYVDILQKGPTRPPYLGPCSMAAHLGQNVDCPDLEGDERWAPAYKNLMHVLGIESCYATPIVTSAGVMGSFTLYDPTAGAKERRGPLIEIATHLAAIAIESRRQVLALQESNRRKTEFLAMLAHELRNPLAPIDQGLEILRGAGVGSRGTTETMDTMRRQVDTVIRLVDDLLDVNRLSQGKIQIRMERSDLLSTLRQAIKATRGSYVAKRQRLTLALPSEELTVMQDRTRMVQVMTNLLENASKYTKEGGRIRLSAESRKGEALIGVRDEGVGIPAGDLSRIFDLFVQLEDTPDQSRSGLGIGLTLVKNLVELQRGRVSVRSGGVGRGTTFEVRLPLAGAQDRDEPTDEQAAQAAGGRRVLIVNDNRDAATTLALLLNMSGHAASVVGDGASALKAVRPEDLDVVLLDIGLPDMSGYELARRLRAKFGEDHLKLVAVTGWGEDESRRKSRQAGIDAHLVKPVRLKVLLDLLGELGIADIRARTPDTTPA